MARTISRSNVDLALNLEVPRFTISHDSPDLIGAEVGYEDVIACWVEDDFVRMRGVLS